LIKYFGNIRFAVTVFVFQDENAIAHSELRLPIHGRPVIISFTHPHAPAMVYIDIDRVDDVGF
jgi:hypothetical protein